MASKKKRGGSDDFGFDDDLNFDIPDFGGGDSAATQDDRKPITKGLKSAAAGFGKSFTSEARLRKTLTKSLPKQYDEPISKAFELRDGARDLYNIAGSQVSETVREVKRSTGRIARNLESSLPKGLADKLKAWADTADSGSDSSSANKQQIEQGTIDSAFAGIFAESVKNDADNRKKDTARKVMEDAIDKKRHADMTSILGSIDQSLIAMQTYQDKVGTNYLKKSLELEFRSYFVQNDMLQLQTKFFQEFKDDLNAITKNTGLPDYVKKAPKEALLEHLREKTFDSLASTLSKKRAQWMSGVFKKAGDKVKDTMGQVREGLSQILDTVEMASGMAGGEMGPSGVELAGDIAGGWVGGKVQDAAAKRALKFSKNNPGVVRFGNKAGQVANGFPQWVSKEMRQGKFADKIPDWLKDILAQDGEQSGVRLNREVDLDRGAKFSEKNSRSLTVVIPELLARIHQELYVTRTGDTTAGPIAYDFDKGKFVSSKERQSKLLKTIVSDKTVERTKSQMADVFKEIDPNNTLDEQTRRKIAENLYGANKSGAFFDREGMLSGVEHHGAQELVRKHLDGDTTGTRERRLSKMFGNVGSQNGEVVDVVQALIDTGRHGELADLGILDLETGRINLAKIRQMELGQDGELKPGPSAGPASSSNPNPNPNNGPGPKSPGSAWKNSNAFKKQGGFINTNIFGGKKGGPPNSTPGNAQDLEQIIAAFKESMQSLNNIKSTGKADDKCCEELNKTIKEFSGKAELIEIRDILKNIEEKGLGGGMMSPEMLEEYMKGKASGYFGKAGQKARGFAAGAAGLFKKGFSTSWDMTKKAGGLAKSIAGGVGGWLSSSKDKFDLYVENELEPRLSKAKLETGKYVDAATGKVITKFEDIKGDIKDIDTNEIVLRISELRKAVLKNIETGKSVLVSTLGWGKKAVMSGFAAAKKSAERLLGASKSVYRMGYAALGAAYTKLVDGPKDVYLKDQYDTPVLLKRVMEHGLYFDKESLDPITKVSQIKGPVVDNEDNVLITKEDLHNGLYDKNGQEIKTGFDRIMQVVGNSFKKSIATYKKMIGGVKDFGAKAMGWMKGLFGFDSPFTVFSKHTNDILTAIYNLLNDRMPGERSPELDAVIGKGSASGSGGIGGAVSGAKATVDKAKNKFKDIKDKYWHKAKGEVDKKTGKIKDGATIAIEKLTSIIDQRLPEAKKAIFGDTDGDGVRDGSFDDLRTKRQKMKDAATGLKDKAVNKGKSLWGSGADALSKYLKKREEKDAENEDKDDGDTFIDLGGDGDEKGKGKDKKPRGKLGRGWDKLKDKLTPKGKGLGARATRAAGRGIGGLASGAFKLGKFGLGAMLGGGLFSASALMSVMGVLGSAVGMAATGVMAVLSSPITVPALALAAAGTAGYLAYKWMTKPDPQPIEKVRLVQYGWKPTDVDAYKKMKQMEQMVAPATIFKGENAEFDPKKLKIQEMMKIYGLDPNNKDNAKKFLDWFANRFRPVYLHHRALIKTSASPKELPDVDNNKPDIKQKYLDECLFPGEHYGISTNPDKEKSYLFTTQTSVERQIKTAKEEVEKEGVKKEADDKVKAAAATGSVVALAKAKIAQESAEYKAVVDADNKAAEATKAKLPFGGDSEKTAQFNKMQASKGLSGAGNGPAGGNPSDPASGPAAPDGAAQPSKSKPGVKPKSGDALKVKDALIKGMPKYGINTPNQQAAILGNIEHESNFQPISENLNYKASTMMKLWPNRFPTMQSAQAVADKGPQGIANSIYGGRMGNTEPNDGYDYRGRGPIQITGKSNYERVSKLIGTNLVNDPDKLITDPQVSAESALAYWKMNPALGKNADAGNFQQVRKLINGGSIGAEDANARTMEYLKQIKSGELNLAGSSSGEGGTVTPTAVVSSPKPLKENTAANDPAIGGVSSNPNTGPTPATYTPKPATPSQMVASPRPSYDPSTAAAPTPAAPVVSQNAYIQKQSTVNTGDSFSIMQKSLDAQQAAVTTLDRIAGLLEGLPKNTAEALAGMLGKSAEAAAPAPAEANNYGSKPTPMPQTSQAFKRSLAGV